MSSHVGRTSNEARESHGRWTAGPGVSKAPAEKVPSEKALLARKFYKKANRKEQRYAEQQESILASGIGGAQTDDNKPVDVTLKIGKIEHGVEVKTLISGKRDKITMNAKAIIKKVAWQSDGNRKIHTVVLDKRGAFHRGANRALFSGHELYYKSGVGSFRVGSMHKVKDYEELMRLFTMSDIQLPTAARGPKR